MWTNSTTKKPAPSGGGWYGTDCRQVYTILATSGCLEKQLFYSSGVVPGGLPGLRLPHPGDGIGELTGAEVGRCELIPPVVADAGRRCST